LVNNTEQVLQGEEAVMVSTGNEHAAWVTSDGSVWTWGGGTHSEMGISIPTGGHGAIEMCPLLLYRPDVFCPAAVMVACGSDFTLVLTEVGGVWSCGRGCTGESGLNNWEGLSVLTQIHPARFGGLDDDGSPVVQIGMIAVGSSHSMSVGNGGGRLWTWGKNNCGQLGHSSVNTDTDLCTLTEINLTTFNNIGVTTVATDPVEFVDGGTDFTMMVTVSGAVWGCGNCCHGELGLGIVRMHNVLQRATGHELLGEGGARTVACGAFYTLIVTHSNVVWSCGYIGNPVRGRMKVPICLSGNHFDNVGVMVTGAGCLHSAAVTTQGCVYTWGDAEHDEPHGLGFYSTHCTTPHKRFSKMRCVRSASAPGMQRRLRMHWLLPWDSMNALAVLLATHL